MLRLSIDTQSSGGSSVSDKSEGPGWWQASEGQWYPPDQHPSFRDDSGGQAPARTVAAQTSSPPRAEASRSQRSEEPAEPVRSEEKRGPGGSAAPAGRQFPDLFQKALQGSHLADNITVKYDGDDERNEPAASGGSSGRSGSMRTVAAGGGQPVAAGTAGVTFAAPAKRKWRKGR